jgi:mRNA interferase RelE/StbE
MSLLTPIGLALLLFKILATIDGLSEEPRPPGAKRLSGQERYRVRQGDYPIVYEVRDDEVIVAVLKVGHRRDVYRRN